ncbi:MAG: D-glycero-beta-D-manno-heptose-7-phosphate kinase, partial [Deltaproteobacteria bacterium]|nr:D-glycero-beta-D-manno-heptose-7-phosphate kinase [Deltaproteobacteria bacterium]
MAFDLSSFSNTSILVVGDVMLDRFLWGEVVRISPEAPVPIFKINQRSAVLGGAANVAANLAGLSCRVFLLGVCGSDDDGEILVQKLEQAGIENYLFQDDSRPTITKTRVIAKGQQLIRLDEEKTHPCSPETAKKLAKQFRGLLSKVQVVILSDYEKGLLGAELCPELISLGRKAGLPILIDPKGRDWERYRGATCLTPNTAELELVTGNEIESESELIEKANAVRETNGYDWLLISRGAEGMVLVGEDTDPLVIPARAKQVYDVSGAGDTVIAVLGAGVGAELDFREAAHLANTAAGVVIGKLGTQPIAWNELLAAWQYNGAGPDIKISGLTVAEVQVDAWRGSGDRIVFTNGCFDLLHAGHVKLLYEAAREGDKLVVGLNSDTSTRRLKGPDRPVVRGPERAQVLAALDCVDMVVIFEEDTPIKLIE